MSIQIPDKGTFSQYTAAHLKTLVDQAETEYSTLKDSVTPETVTDEQLDQLRELQEFIRVDAPEEFTSRQRRQDEFAALSTDTKTEAPPTEPDPEPEPVVASATTNSSTEVITVKVSDITSNGGGSNGSVVPVARPVYSALVAAAGVPNYEAGQPLNGMLDVAKAFIARSNGHSRVSGKGTVHDPSPVAQLIRTYPDEFSVEGDATDYAKLLKVADETRLPGGSLLASVEQRQKEIQATQPGRDALVAAMGWCAPSETDYGICLQISTDGLADFPEVQARRGGIRHNTGIQFDEIFGGGNCADPTGNFNLTEAQVASGTVKTCLEIPCPDFIDTRLGVTGLCLTGNILAIRGYPEFTATFTRGALAAMAHHVNREQIADVVADSVAVTLSGAPWATDGTVVSQVMSAVELATMDIKYKQRMMQSATLEIIMPFWILAQMRADWIRRNATGSGPEAITLADSAINAGFAARGARVQYVYDWQDAFATCAASGSPGSETPIQAFPTTLQFVVYPAGTWIRAVSDVITLNSVYDSTLLATNQVTHLFTETGWAMIRMCPISRVYTVDICPSGSTGVQREVTC